MGQSQCNTDRPVAAARNRADWTALADRLLAGAVAHASPRHALILFPGDAGGYGRDVDGLEGFARTFLLAAFRIAGERGHGLDDLLDFYRSGIVAGVDPTAGDRWVTLREHPQAKVEAASIALALDLTRDWLWASLDLQTQTRLIDYLSAVIGDQTYPRTNWLWFRVIVQTFLRSVGGPWSPTDLEEDLTLHASFRAAGGWLSDGQGRAYDHYVGWALHLLPVLWSRMQGASDLTASQKVLDTEALGQYLQDALHLIGSDGAPLFQGRSLIYRFAAAGPFWAGVLAEVPGVPLGQLRHAADRIVGHFTAAGAPDQSGLLSMGWHGPWRQLAQSYSGPGSPYWAVKGLLGVALPEEHPVWEAAAGPLPIDQRDSLRAVVAPGWIASGTAGDGIIRVINHGTDHARPGELIGDSPLYARIGYSTATTPLLDQMAWTTPLEQSVVLLNSAGEATHRTGMQLLRTEILECDGVSVGLGASEWTAHWLNPSADQQRHGSGLQGQESTAGTIRVTSAVRGPWELRLTEVLALDTAVTADALTLRIGGWSVTGDPGPDQVGPASLTIQRGHLTSGLQSLSRPEAHPQTHSRGDASPLGSPSALPALDLPVELGARIFTLVTLAGITAPESTHAGAALLDDPVRPTRFRWPDGVTTDLAPLFELPADREQPAHDPSDLTSRTPRKGAPR